jgi:hypothetical protein
MVFRPFQIANRRRHRLFMQLLPCLLRNQLVREAHHLPFNRLEAIGEVIAPHSSSAPLPIFQAEAMARRNQRIS